MNRIMNLLGNLNSSRKAPSLFDDKTLLQKPLNIHFK